jgi:hypothetical protein
MKLGKKSVQNSLFENIKSEEGVQEMVTPPRAPEVRQQAPAALEEQLDQES